MAELRLFRDAAIEAKSARWHGEIVMSQPLPAKLVAGACATFLVALALIMILGTYTKRVTVVGQLVPDMGLVRIYVPQAGVLVEKHVVEGQQVRKGDVLFVVSSDRQTAAGAAQAAISDQTRLQKSSLQEELAKNERLLGLDRASLESSIADLQAEMSQLEEATNNQRNRVDLSRLSLERYEQLSNQGFVTHDHLLQKQTDLLEQRGRLESLQRDQITARRALNEARRELAALPLKHANSTAQLQRALASLEQNLTESEVQRRYLVVATEGGMVSTITAHRGQWVDGTMALATVVPDGARLEAELYAPSRAIGFVSPGDEVYLRYQAFPYQKYGQQRGTVAGIANTPLTSAELARVNVFTAGAAGGGEPMYRIAVDLQPKSVDLYSKKNALRTGMLLDADVVQEKRQLYEWALQPLYTLSRKQ
jgi:membrane fusion protein